MNEVRFGWFNDKQFDYPNDALGYPGHRFPRNQRHRPEQSRHGDGLSAHQSARKPLSSIADTLTWTKGSTHAEGSGSTITRTEDYTNLLFNRTGTYTFPNWTAFALDFSGNTTGAKNWSTFTQTIGNPEVDLYITDYSAFVQDQMQGELPADVEPRSALRLHQAAATHADQPGLPGHRRIPTYNKAFAPRVGFAYSFDDQSKTVIRAGYGIFYGRYPGGLLNTFFLGQRPVPEVDFAELLERQRQGERTGVPERAAQHRELSIRRPARSA